MKMYLTILLPKETLLDCEVSKVVAEAPNGFFCLLPRHIDFVAAIAPGILSFTRPDGEENFVALDEGILVKQSSKVVVSTLNGAIGEGLGRLKDMVAERFQERDEREMRALQAAGKIEAGFVRRFLHIQQIEI